MNPPTCYTIKVIEETNTNVAGLPSFLAKTSTNFEIKYTKIPTQTLTQSQMNYKYRFQAINVDNGKTIESTQFVEIAVQHLCIDVQLMPTTDISTYYVIGDANCQISVPNLSLN